MLPNFVVIGPPRCGTTWIHYNLRAHPDVFVPKAKELHFFDRHYERGIESYEAEFRDWNGQTAIGEITPDYLSGSYSANRNIPETMHRHLPHARLIAVLRNPVERAYSHYWYNLAQDARNLGLSFEEKLEERPQILAEGMYAESLQRYFALFGKEQVLVSLYDDLGQDARGFMRRMYAYLGVDPEFVSGLEGSKRNSAAGRGNLARSQLLWQASRALAKLGMVGVAERLRQANGRFPLPPMNAGTRRRLVEHYRASNARLEELLGRDLRHWNEC